MKRILSLVLAACLASAAAPSSAQTEPLAIFDQSTELAAIRLQDVDVERLDGGALKIVNKKKGSWPGVHFEKKLDLTNYFAIDVELTNASAEEITLYLRLDSEGYDPRSLLGTTTRSVTLKPNEKKVWRVELPKYLNLETRKKLFAMRGKPGGIKTDSYSVDKNIEFDPRTIVAIRPFENQNGRGDSWILHSITALPKDQAAKDEEYLAWGPDKFFPMIDEFGQFMHADWPGKTHSLEELRAQIEIENADLEKNQPTEFNRYGGWTKGPQLEATGSFRVEKYNGFWYLVDPEGRLFWSHGVDCVGHSNAITPISDREFYFCDKIPMKRTDENELSQFLGTSDRSVNNYYANYGTFWTYNFSASNLYLKYGKDWVQKEKESIKRRLRSWGLNTIGNWSDMNIAEFAKTPYVTTVNSSGRQIEGSQGYWGKFTDPFDPKFGESVERSVKARKGTEADPFCVGYFVDNEISWGEAGSLAKAALLSPKDQPVKAAYVAWLKEKYGDIEKFNAAWQVKLDGWDALQEQTVETPKNDAANKDSNAFYTVICEKYFAEVADAVHRSAPGKLYLGCRFAWTNDLARAAAQKYCDVVSYNFYKREIGGFKPVEGEDKPVIIGEFHFGALDRGMFHTGLVSCNDQNGRANAYKEYVQSALRNPWIVGTHWFQYGDQPTTGRFDGENYQIGLVDVCDVPYYETINAIREVGYSMYETREAAAKAGAEK